MMASMAGYILNDTLFKLVMVDLALFQSIFLRGIMASCLILGLAHYFKALQYRPSKRDRRLIAWRVVGEVGGTVTYLTALSYLPIANATAILQALPLTCTFAASMLLGETVGWRRYSAIAIGFCGVLIIVRPGADGFDMHALWATISVVFLTLRDLMTRQLSPEVPSLFVTVLTSLTITALALLLLPLNSWEPVETIHLIWLGMASVVLIAGYLFGVMTMRVGEISFVSPFRYSILIWAILLGFFVFGEWPDTATIVGAVIVVATGVYTFYRERRLGLSPKNTISKR